jgi:hypothetical protein
MVYAGPTLWELDQAEEVMRWYREFLPNAPEELYGFFAFLIVPPGPPFPEHLHNKNMCGVVWCYSGPLEGAEEAFRPIRQFGPPALDLAGPMPLPALNSLFDELYPPGLQWYWKGDFVSELSDEAIALRLEHFVRCLIGQSVTTVRKPAQSILLTDRNERLAYGLHQSLLRASLEAAQDGLDLREGFFNRREVW